MSTPSSGKSGRGWPGYSPLFLFLIYFTSDTASWDVFILIPLSPVIIVAYALLNMIPRRIIGKNKALPDGSALLICLLLVHWWALIIFEQFAYGSVGNFRWLSSETAATFAIFSLFVSLLAWFGLLLSPTFDTAHSRRKKQWLWRLAALVLPPLIVAGILSVLCIGVTSPQKDAGGMTEMKALTVSGTRALEQRESRWDGLQQAIVPLRDDIAADGWIPLSDWYGFDLEQLSSGVMRADGLESSRTSFASYTVNAVWQLEVSAPLDTVRERIREVVDEHAWTSPVPPKDKRIELDGQRQLVIEQFTLTDSKGTWVTISVQLPRTDHFEYVDDGTSVVTVHAESPEYWQEKGFLDDWRAATNSPGLDEHSTFTSQEWPEMRSVQGPR